MEPRPSRGEPPIRTPPARPTLSRRGVTTQPAARFRPRRAGLGLKRALKSASSPVPGDHDAPCRCRRSATEEPRQPGRRHHGGPNRRGKAPGGPNHPRQGDDIGGRHSQGGGVSEYRDSGTGGHHDPAFNHTDHRRGQSPRGGPWLWPGPVRVDPAGRYRLLQPHLRHRRDRQLPRVRHQCALCVREPEDLGLDHPVHRHSAVACRGRDTRGQPAGPLL